MSLKSFFWINWHRLENRFQDARARLAGACNADTWTGEGRTGYAGGYSHWRCGRERGHEPPHRFNNYTWTGSPNDRTKFDPLPIFKENSRDWFDSRKVIPFWKLAEGRNMTVSRRRARQRSRLIQASVNRPRKIEDPRLAATEDIG